MSDTQTNVVVKYEHIISAIGQQLQSVLNALIDVGDKEIANIKNIEISDEQSFVNKEQDKQLKVGTVYIVVRFGVGTMNFGSTISPVSLYCIGTPNKVKPIQHLLGTFVSTWSTKNLMQGLKGEELYTNMIQVWNTPEIVTNFNGIDNEFRNLYRVIGNIVIGPAAIRMGTLTYIYDKEAYDNDNTKGCETVNIMSFQDGYRASLDTQPFGNTCGFTKSEVNFSTYTFSITTYLLAGRLSSDLLAIRGFRNRKTIVVDEETVIDGEQSYFSPNDTMIIKLEFTNGFTNMPSDADDLFPSGDKVANSDFFQYFKVVDSNIGQEIAGIPTLTITFTR